MKATKKTEKVMNSKMEEMKMTKERIKWEKDTSVKKRLKHLFCEDS